MSEFRFDPNFPGFAAMAVGPEAQAMTAAAAAKALAIAEGLAADFAVTGDYSASFKVRPDVVRLAGHARAVAILENTSDHALAVEWGNSHDHRAHHVLGRTLDSLGA